MGRLATTAALAMTVADGGVLAGQQATASPIRVVSFAPPSGILAAGDSAVTTMTVRNAGATARRVWFGYSVQDAAGRWYDIPAHAVTLGPRASATARKSWRVPADSVTDGWYRVVMAVWSAEPGTAGAVRLASVDREQVFRVRRNGVTVSDASSDVWRAAGHHLGRGRLRPDHAVHRGDGFALRLVAGHCDGAEIRTIGRVGFGEYTARMRTPDAPGSLSAFFLYEDVRHDNAEIDIEIYNDGSRRVLLTTWVAGKQVTTTEVRLPFDPAAGFHDYTIRWSDRELVFLADGIALGRTTRLFPKVPMRLMASVWWPTWMDCTPPATDRELAIERIRIAPVGK